MCSKSLPDLWRSNSCSTLLISPPRHRLPSLHKFVSRGFCGKHKLRKLRDLAFKHKDVVPTDPLGANYSIYPSKGSYKDAVLSQDKSPYFSSSSSPAKKKASSLWRNRPSRAWVRRCYRCLASDHRVSDCRDPVKCLRCLGIGHCAAKCKKTNLTSDIKMNGANHRQRRGRTPSLKAFVSYTEEYMRRIQLRRNALLADLVQPTDLSLAPQQAIANALARRFGSYAHDFFVARYRKRDFVVLFPRCLSAEVLIRRQIVTLDNIWLRCYHWAHTGTPAIIAPTSLLGSNYVTCHLSVGPRPGSLL